MYRLSGGDDRGGALGQLAAALDVSGRPSTHRSASSRDAEVNRCNDSTSARPMTGIMTFSSKAPEAPANATVASLPITWAHTIRVASGTTGLTLPGMMLDPGCRSGRYSSPRPARGPEPIQRRSLQIFTSPTATVHSCPDGSVALTRST